MRHIFIVNSIAGKRMHKIFVPQVVDWFAQNGGSYEIIYTEYAGHCVEIAKALAQTGEKLRIYACGGDGTLFETVNGIYGYSNVSVGHVPLGSGNDFIRYFGNKPRFLNIECLVNGSAVTVDVLKVGDEYCINQCSAGMDAMAAANMVKFRRWPLVSGKMAYYLGIFYTFLKKIRFSFDIDIDGSEPIKRDCLFVVAANSQYHGGGFKGAPEANPTDGLIECVTISAVSRLKVLRLLGKYRIGEHTGLDIYNHYPAERVSLSADREFVFVLDGEIRFGNNIEISIVKNAVDFILPVQTVGRRDSEAVPSATKATAITPACDLQNR